jgi:hypothetical protein
MPFLGGLLFHAARVIAGLVAVAAVIVAIVFGLWVYAFKPAGSGEELAVQLKEESAPVVVAAPEPPATATEEPGTPVRVVTPPAPPDEPAPAAAPLPPPAPRIDAIAKLDDATRDYLDNITYLIETDTPSKPQKCGDGRLDWVLWVSVYDTWRSELARDEFTAAETLSFIFTMGASAVLAPGPGNERWTIFSGETSGRYITLNLGESRRDSSWDKVGPQIRMTLYRIDDNRVGLVEQAPIDSPPAARPAKKAPKMRRIYIVCRDGA